MAIIVRRFCEVLGSCTILSSGVNFLYMFGILSSQKTINMAIFFGIILFFSFNVHSMYNCYMFLINKWHFWLFNIVGYLLFLTITYLCYCFFEPKIYIWIFGITKFLYFNGIIALWIITVFHMCMLFVIFLLPFCVSCIKVQREDQRWITEVFVDGEEWYTHVIM